MTLAAVVFGLASAALYGTADFCGGLATRRSAIYAVVVISQLVGFVLVLAIVPFTASHATLADYGWGALAGACGGLGLALLYHALSIGKMGVVSPITAVLAAGVPVVLGVVFRHDALTWVQRAGIAVALLAIVLISRSRDDADRVEGATAGVKEAVVSGIALSSFYVCLALTHPASGVQPVLAARFASAALLFLIGVAAGTPVRAQRGALPLIALAGALDASANVLYVLALRAGYLPIAAVLTSLYPASTVFLARAVLKERLQPIQKLGVACALAGVILIVA